MVHLRTSKIYIYHGIIPFTTLMIYFSIVRLYIKGQIT